MILTAYIDVNGQVMYLSPERQPHVLAEHYTWGNKDLLAKFPDKNIFTSAFAVDLQDSFAKRLTAAKTLDKTTEATAEVILRLIKTYNPSSQKENLSFENYAKDAASFLCSSVAVWGEPFQAADLLMRCAKIWEKNASAEVSEFGKTILLQYTSDLEKDKPRIAIAFIAGIALALVGALFCWHPIFLGIGGEGAGIALGLASIGLMAIGATSFMVAFVWCSSVSKRRLKTDIEKSEIK